MCAAHVRPEMDSWAISTHVMMVVRVRVLVLHGVPGQGAIVAVWVARRVHADRAVQQCQAVWQLVVEVMTALGQHGPVVPVAPVDAPVDATGARKSGVLQDVAVHLRRLVQVARGVVFYGGRKRGRDRERERGR